MKANREVEICAAVVGDLAIDARVWKEARSLAAAGFRVGLIGCRHDIDATRERDDHGIIVVEVPLGSRSGRVSRVRRARTLVRIWFEVLRTEARAYHCHNVHAGPGSVLAAWFRRAPLVYDGHELYGDVWAEHSTPLQRAVARGSLVVERFLVRRADAVITTNPSRADVLARRHGRPNVAVLRNVPPLEQTLIELDPGYPADVPVLLYQGGVYAEARAFRETIAALRRLPQLHFVILGFGRERDLALIREWAARDGVADRVHLLGARPFEELVRTAAAATCGLVPIKPNNNSMNDVLADTNKLHEYLMAGLPVVGSDLPEIARVCREGDPPVGEVFDPQSAQSIADAVSRLLSDENTYRRRRAEARRIAVERYNWEIEEGKLIEIYRRVLDSPGLGDIRDPVESDVRRVPQARNPA